MNVYVLEAYTLILMYFNYFPLNVHLHAVHYTHTHFPALRKAAASVSFPQLPLPVLRGSNLKQYDFRRTKGARY